MKRNKNLPFKVGDICFLPKQISYKEVSNSAMWFLRNNKEIIEKEFSLINLNYAFEFLQILKIRYTENLYEFDSFFEKLPKKVQRHIATSNVIANEDAFMIVPSLPYTQYGYIILEGGIISDAIRAFGLERLFGVRQLGFMMNPISREIELNSATLGFDHTRGIHSLDVVAYLRLIEINNPNIFNSNLLSIGGISHDALTPAGSDTTKLINLNLFDEDIHYGELLNGDGWNFLKMKYGVHEEELKEMILNKGPHGQALDIADKLAYTGRDTWMFVGIFEKLELELKSLRYREIENIIKKYPNFCNVLENVKIQKNKEMTVGNGLKLSIFLTVRALMSTELYNNKFSRFLEYMLSKRVIKLLFENGSITYNELLRWKDFQLEEKIWEFLGCKYYPTSFKKSHYEKFVNNEERQNRLTKLKENNSIVAIPDDFISVANKTGVDKFFVKRKNKIMTLRQALPEKAREIEKIMTFEPSFGLYAISLGDLEVPLERYQYIKSTLENM